MDEEAAAALSNGLKSLTKLEVLDISNNPLEGAVTVIVEHLQSTPFLTELYMTGTGMGCDEATAVARSLKFLKNLRMLSVGSNPLGRGVHALVQHLSKMPKLKGLNLTSVEMGDDEVKFVSNTCKKVQALTITTDYLDANGERLPERVITRSSETNDEWGDDYDDYDEDLDSEEDDDEEYDEEYDDENDYHQDDYDEDKQDYSPFPEDYDDDTDESEEEDEEEDDIDEYDEEYDDENDYYQDDFDEDKQDYSLLPGDYDDDTDEDEEKDEEEDDIDDDQGGFSYDDQDNDDEDDDESENDTDDDDDDLF